jgi:hypothetical protein
MVAIVEFFATAAGAADMAPAMSCASVGPAAFLAGGAAANALAMTNTNNTISEPGIQRVFCMILLLTTFPWGDRKSLT